MPEMLITYARFGSSLHQSGSTPEGFRTFVVPAASCQDFWWLGYDVNDNCVLRFGTESELAAVSHGNFTVFTMSLRSDYLENLTASLGLPSVTADRGVVRLTVAKMADLRALARSATFELSAQLRGIAMHELAQRLVIHCAAGETVPSPSPCSRDRSITRVIEYLDQHVGALPDLPLLCKIANVSERTLQYAFRERYGLSPNQFVRCWQLNTARRLILSSGRGARSIAAIAAECGFLDPSVFAKHYRMLHGERPSATAAKLVR